MLFKYSRRPVAASTAAGAAGYTDMWINLSLVSIANVVYVAEHSITSCSSRVCRTL